MFYSFSSLSLYSFPWWISELFVAPSQDAAAGAPTKKTAPKEKAATASVAAANTGDDGDDGSTAIKANNVEEIWDIVRVILTAQEQIPCQECSKDTVVSWASNLNPEDNWDLCCEGCQVVEFGGWPKKRQLLTAIIAPEAKRQKRKRLAITSHVMYLDCLYHSQEKLSIKWYMKF